MLQGGEGECLIWTCGGGVFASPKRATNSWWGAKRTSHHHRARFFLHLSFLFFRSLDYLFLCSFFLSSFTPHWVCCAVNVTRRSLEKQKRQRASRWGVTVVRPSSIFQSLVCVGAAAALPSNCDFPFSFATHEAWELNLKGVRGRDNVSPPKLKDIWWGMTERIGKADGWIGKVARRGNVFGLYSDLRWSREDSRTRVLQPSFARSQSSNIFTNYFFFFRRFSLSFLSLPSSIHTVNIHMLGITPCLVYTYSCRNYDVSRNIHTNLYFLYNPVKLFVTFTEIHLIYHILGRISLQRDSITWVRDSAIWRV